MPTDEFDLTQTWTKKKKYFTGVSPVAFEGWCDVEVGPYDDGYRSMALAMTGMGYVVEPPGDEGDPTDAVFKEFDDGTKTEMCFYLNDNKLRTLFNLDGEGQIVTATLRMHYRVDDETSGDAYSRWLGNPPPTIDVTYAQAHPNTGEDPQNPPPDDPWSYSQNVTTVTDFSTDVIKRHVGNDPEDTIWYATDFPGVWEFPVEDNDPLYDVVEFDVTTMVRAMYQHLGPGAVIRTEAETEVNLFARIASWAAPSAGNTDRAWWLSTRNDTKPYYPDNIEFQIPSLQIKYLENT